jgi:hypothetical protein
MPACRQIRNAAVASKQQAGDVGDGELNSIRQLSQNHPARYDGEKKKMQHAALLNPFSPGPDSIRPDSIRPDSIRPDPVRPEPVKIVSRQEQVRIVSRQSTRSTPVCARCESDDIISHVTAQWSNEQQQWELANTFDRPAHCNHCNGACEIKWVAL